MAGAFCSFFCSYLAGLWPYLTTIFTHLILKFTGIYYFSIIYLTPFYSYLTDTDSYLTAPYVNDLILAYILNSGNL